MVTVNIFSTILLAIAFMDCLLPSDGKNCPALHLVNGRIRSSLRGRNVRFNCNRGYQLVGARYAICTNGKWDVDKPICVKYGCLPPSTIHVNGQFIESYRGAVVKIICNPGYSLVGSPSVYCNGMRWNETFPVCKVSTKNPALSCDFEKPDLCGWSQDPMHDFDWRRVEGASPGENVSEPAFDHTFGENGSGHFMQMGRFKSNFENATARLYSPVYPPNYSVNSCFTFWYYMNGTNTGSLKIYVKPERTELYNLIPFFWVNEDPGKSWTEGLFSLKPTNSPFQIVVEGIKGPGYVNDTGFDDVKIGFGDECVVPEEITTTSIEFSTTVSSTDDEMLTSALFSETCKNKCNQSVVNESCGCTLTCLKNGNCCTDFTELCNAPVIVSSSTISITTLTTRKITKSTMPPTAKAVEKIPLPPKVLPPPTGANNESNYIDPHNPVTSLPPKNVTNNLDRKLEKHDEISKSKLTNPESEKNKNKSTQWKIPIFEPPNIKFPKPMVNKMETQGQKENKEKEKPTKAVMSSKDFPKAKADVNRMFGEKNVTLAKENRTIGSATSASTTLTPKPNSINLTKYETLSVPSESGLYKRKPKELSGKEPPQAIKIDKQDQRRKTTLQGILQIGGAALVVLIIVVLGVFWYQRSKNRKSERESMIEDSDSIIYEMDSSTLGSESHSLVCIRPKGLNKSL